LDRSRETLNVPVPPLMVRLPGRTALPSLLVIWTVPE
jgi:hypothetical protein